MGRTIETSDQATQMEDAFGVPQFFVTEFVTEPAGGGCVRLYGCIRQRGMLIPQYQAVIPYGAVLVGARQVQEAAMAALKLEIGADVAH